VLICGGEVSPIGNQKRGDYDLYKELFWEKFPQSHHISRGTKKVEITIFRP